jgi:signal transduction histidine kinase
MLVLALVPIVGYAYGATGLYAVARYTGIALHTGIALFVLGFAIIAARPDVGPAAAFSSDAPHSVVARRLLVQTFVLVVTLGYVRLVGERRGWYDTGFGAAFMVVVTVVLLSFTIWRAAVALGHSERARQKAQQDLDALLVSERSARELAERADGAKDEFIATLSHELRTPLNAIIGWTQMLQRGNVPEATRGKATEVVFRNATVLARLIDDLLETSRIATGNLELSQASVDLDAVVHAAIDAVMPVAQGKDLSITLDSAPGLPRVIGDAGRLQQVIWNLLSNAIKFSTRGGQVGVTVSAVADGVIVRVRDHGPGIDAVLMPHVFDRFRQGAPSESGGTGLGLGLYIAKHIVERHGGTIRVESAGAGAGAMFTVALPTATAIEQV